MRLGLAQASIAAAFALAGHAFPQGQTTVRGFPDRIGIVDLQKGVSSGLIALKWDYDLPR